MFSENSTSREAPGVCMPALCCILRSALTCMRPITRDLQNKGLKLRISIPDTFIIRNGSLSAWFQTCDDGYVVRLSPGKLTPENVYKAIVRKEVIDQNINPHRYVAIAHFARHASRLLRKEELDVLVRMPDGPDQCLNDETLNDMRLNPCDSVLGCSLERLILPGHRQGLCRETSPPAKTFRTASR